MQLLLALSIASLAGLSAACDAYTGGLPTATGTVSSSAVIEVAAGETFDGGWKKYDRGSGACSDQSEGDYEDAVFYLHEGATLQNVIIGANQAEGVRTSFSVPSQTRSYPPPSQIVPVFEDVCEDAITIKNDEAGDYTNIIGGGAYHAEDKVIQHNGCGTVNIINFFVSDYGKLYRSCGNCKSQCSRNVYISGVYAEDVSYEPKYPKIGGTLAGINSNYGDTATIIDSCYDTSHPCTLYDGCAGDCEPEVVGYCSG
ncbi:polysaccharide lyase family 3 protein [Armillaria fumosa]|nr:polysaccharide lyase family 3 protein [Armillaria fumosa]